ATGCAPTAMRMTNHQGGTRSSVRLIRCARACRSTSCPAPSRSRTTTSTAIPGPHFGPSRATTSKNDESVPRGRSSRTTVAQTRTPLMTQGRVGLQGGGDGCSVDTLDPQHRDEGLTVRRRDGLVVAPQIGLELERDARQRGLLGRVVELGGEGNERGRADGTVARASAREGPRECGENQAPVVHAV